MKCRKRVGNSAVTFSCTIPVPSGEIEHQGPCSAIELPPSVAARQEWERQERLMAASGEEARATLAKTQSQPMTFHDMNNSVGTPVPGSGLSVQDHRDAIKPKVGEFGVDVTHPSCSHPYIFITQNDDGSTVCRKCGDVLEEGPDNPQPSTIEDDVREGMAASLGRSQAMIDEALHNKPTKQRPGDQDLPRPTEDVVSVQDKVIEAMEESKRVGIERYGQPLHIFNGRDTLRDAHEEARDLMVYATALAMEREEILRRFEACYGIILSTTMGSNQALLENLDFILSWLRGEPTPT